MNTHRRCFTAVLHNASLFVVGVLAIPFAAHAWDVPGQTLQADEQPASAGALSLEQLPPEMRGDLLMTRRQYLSAISAYKQASLASPVLQNKIGIAYHQMFDLLDARRSYEQALRLNPQYAEALNNL